MVDALNRTRRWLRPDGCLIDLHPGEESAYVEVVTPAAAGRNARLQQSVVRVGEVHDESDAKGPLGRHHAADLALDAAIANHGWTLDARSTFNFATEGDSAEEVDAYLRRKWRAAQLDAHTIDRAHALLREHPGAAVRVVEHVVISRLAPPRLAQGEPLRTRRNAASG
jgi:hypothetical protein